MFYTVWSVTVSWYKPFIRMIQQDCVFIIFPTGSVLEGIENYFKILVHLFTRIWFVTSEFSER